jgi:hypothetical protein
MKSFIFEITTARGMRIKVTIKAHNRQEAERLLWRKIEAEGLDLMPNDSDTEKGLPN